MVNTFAAFELAPLQDDIADELGEPGVPVQLIEEEGKTRGVGRDLCEAGLGGPRRPFQIDVLAAHQG